MRFHRTGIDIDGKSIPSQLKMLTAYLEPRYFGFDTLAEESPTGFHVKIATGKHVWALRYRYGDDPHRLEMDEEREKYAPHWIDTLFNYKKDRRGSRKYEQFNPLSLPFWIPRTILKKRRKKWKDG